MWISILLVVLLVLPAEGRADGKVAVGEPGREAQGPCLGRPLPLQVRCHRRLWCLVRVRAVQVFIYFTDLSNLCPLQRKHRVLTTGPPRNSKELFF